jgi:peptidoglycan/LPS O-acetylase OafA/YrhL
LIRVHRRGPFGRKSKTALRSLYALVLGFGGLFAGILVVLTAFPTLPINDELVTSFSVGLPVGLGLYLAWVDREWSATTKAIGLAVGLGGALVGAWLGFNVTSAGFGMLAPFVAVIGAVAGGNLLLLGLDIAWDRQLRSRVAPSAKDTLEARPSLG